MTTLTTAPVAPLLNRLFEEADEASPMASPAVAALSSEERARLMRSKTDYLDFYGRLKDLPLAVSRETGTLLYMLARSCGARTIVEFGTSFGISTLHLAAALRDNGGGHLITSEFEPSKVARARDNLTTSGLIDLVEIRDAERRSPRNGRPAAARRRQGPLSRDTELGGEPPQARRVHRRRQRRFQPRLP
jgi:predicted O-methyltransferase YrrM